MSPPPREPRSPHPHHTLRVAAVQPRSENGDPDGNLARAAALAEEAAAKGALLILFPELLRAGYDLSPALWTFAEPSKGGATERWLKQLCASLNVFAGTTFLEARAGHFYNTFIMCGPRGSVGRSRKSRPASFEAFLTTGDEW